MINTYFYSHPQDGGLSRNIKKALKKVGLWKKVVEINPLCILLENRQLMRHNLSVCPCVVLEVQGEERMRFDFRLEVNEWTPEKIDSIFSDQKIVELIVEAEQEQAIRLESERVHAENLGFVALAQKKQAEIDKLLGSIAEKELAVKLEVLD